MNRHQYDSSHYVATTNALLLFVISSDAVSIAIRNIVG
jgi:hypothetical protein